MKGTRPGKTLFVGELSFQPKNPNLRRLLRVLEKTKHALFHKRHLSAPDTDCLALDEAVASAGGRGKDLKAQAASIRTLMEEGLEPLRSLVAKGETEAGLRHRGLNLAWVYCEQILFLLARFNKIRHSLDQAVKSAKPDRVVVHDARSLEGLALKALKKQRGATFKTVSAVPTWFSWLESGIFLAVRTVFLFLLEHRFPLALARIVRPGQNGHRTDRPEVLAFCPGLVSTQGVVPVIRELLRRGDTSLSVLYKLEVHDILKNLCRETGCRLEVEDSFPGSSWTDILRHLPIRLRATAALRACGVGFQGVPLHEIVRMSRVQFSALSFVAAASFLATCARKLGDRRPRAVLVGNCSKWRFKVLDHILKRAGTTSIYVQDGIIGKENPAMACSSSEHMCVGGEAVRKAVRRLGLTAEVHLTGLPKYDDYVSAPVRPREKVCRDLGLSGAGALILMASHHNMDPGEKREIARTLLDWLEKRPPARLVFKLHPYEQDGIIADLVEASALPDRAKVVREFVTRDLLAAADLSLVRMGSCGIESLLVGTPVAEINFSGTPDDRNTLGNAGIAPIAFTDGELNGILDGFMAGETIGRAHGGEGDLADYLGPLDGRASARCAEVVSGIARHNPQPDGALHA